MISVKLLLAVQLVSSTYEATFRIIGGSRIAIAAAPYQLSLRRGGVHTCGAAILSPRVAISAAHCFPSPAPYSVKAGASRLDEPGIVVHVNVTLLHPLFKMPSTDYDLALLFLASPLPLSGDVQPVALPKAGRRGRVRSGMLGTVSGWGKRSIGSKRLRSVELRAVEVPVVPQEKCEDIYYHRITDRMFCAGLRRGGKDSCKGDSGGPFVVGGVLYGVVSSGAECAQPGYPGIYTNVQALRGFIRENAGL